VTSLGNLGVFLGDEHGLSRVVLLFGCLGRYFFDDHGQDLSQYQYVILAGKLSEMGILF
jgi:hypothetical protein